MRRMQSLRDQESQGVIHRLQGDRTDLGPDGLGHGVGRDVRLSRDRSQDRQPLCCDLNTASAKKGRRVDRHRWR